MKFLEMLNGTRTTANEPPVCYLVRIVHPIQGKIAESAHGSMKEAVARGAALMREGYSIEIWSPAFLEKRSRHVCRPTALRNAP